MSNVETKPVETECEHTPAPQAGGRPVVEALTAREVPLGGPRAMTVRRTIPQRQRSLIGAWCFADHYGPDEVAASGGMDVPPHPHTGLQTVSWLFAGEIEHRDSGGHHALVRPGEMNLMTGGHGICHSEVSTPGTRTLHGVQLWVALPAAARDEPRAFQHHVPPPVRVEGATVRVLLGTLLGQSSPVRTFTPLLGAEVVLEPGARLTVEVDPSFEHGVLADTDGISLEGTALARAELGFLGPGADRITLTNSGGTPGRLVLLGGTPFDEDILMWWNFVGRSHEEIEQFRAEWQAGSDRFGRVEGYTGSVERLPAPELPHVRIRPRQNPPPPTAPTA
ncbi:MAG TPA: pirin family protein [Pedococcus sp.]|nr:pirin family protein [Pedococcus sp.]